MDLSFIHHANNYHPRIRFTYEMFLTKITFLDTTVAKISDGIMSTIYCKSTDKHRNAVNVETNKKRLNEPWKH